MQIVLEILDIILQVVTWFIIIQIVLSWLIAFNVVSMQNDLVRQLVESLHRITEPLYRPVRKIMPDLGMIDLAPMVVILIVMMVAATTSFALDTASWSRGSAWYSCGSFAGSSMIEDTDACAPPTVVASEP